MPSISGYYRAILVLLVFFTGFFLRFYQLGVIPAGLYTDETAIGYNAYSILETGRDEHGKYLPLYFESFGDYKLPGYIYMVAVSEKLFGINAFAVRFPSAIFGFLTIVALYFLVLILSKRFTFAIIASVFLAFNPWHVFFSRAAFEVNVATAFAVFGTLFFILAVTWKNNLFLFIAAIISFAVSLYTYNVTRIISPLLLTMLIVLYHKKVLKLSLWKKGILLLLSLAFLLPFLFTLQSSSGLSSQLETLLAGKLALANFLEMRSYTTEVPILSKFFFNTPVQLFWQYLKNLTAFFSFPFFFTNGPVSGLYGVGNTGTFYIFDLPFIIISLYEGIRKKVSYLYPFYVWLLIIFLIGSFVREVPYPTRDFIIVIPLIIFSAYGCVSILDKFLAVKNKNFFIFTSTFFLIVFYSVVSFLTTYFLRFPIEHAKDWRREDQALVSYLQKKEKSVDTIYLDKSADFSYTSLLFYQKYSPVIFQKEAKYISNGLLERPEKIGKYVFSKDDLSKTLQQQDILLVTGSSERLSKGVTLKKFYYPTRPVVLAIDKTIVYYPTTDIAYHVMHRKKKIPILKQQ